MKFTISCWLMWLAALFSLNLLARLCIIWSKFIIQSFDNFSISIFCSMYVYVLCCFRKWIAWPDQIKQITWHFANWILSVKATNQVFVRKFHQQNYLIGLYDFMGINVVLTHALILLLNVRLRLLYLFRCKNALCSSGFLLLFFDTIQSWNKMKNFVRLLMIIM